MPGRFAYRTRWGANLLETGEAQFRLWAPDVEQLHLAVAGGELPMDHATGGWFELTTHGVAAGDSYSFQLPDGQRVPDPAARAQKNDVHGPSLLVDPRAYEWRTADWRGRPWEEAVVYELHTGTFSDSGDFAGIARRLDHLADSGVTAIELMPVAQFSGNRGWGYDGVLLYAPHRAYGGPEGLKALVDAAHERGLMVLLDVVYNHFGPDGNYLSLYADDFFNPDRHTPWGAAIAYERWPVRDFAIDNALYWLEEYRFDGLRLDAIDRIEDSSDEHILKAIARAVRARFPDRHIHLTTEDDRNITHLHPRDADGRPILYTAEWNDDVHHAAHVAATGEADGYYGDYHDKPVAWLARALAEGFSYQGEVSQFWGDEPRGEPSRDQPPSAFVSFIQNHDQIGNRAFGERLTVLATARAVETLTAVLLLAPQIPLLFMGEEWGETNPFLFFTDFHGALADAVRQGRRREFRRFPAFADAQARERIPDPNAESTFAASRPDWRRLETAEGKARHDLVKRLLAIRQREIVPRLAAVGPRSGKADIAGRTFTVRWRLGDGTTLMMAANLGEEEASPPATPAGRLLFASAPGLAQATDFPAWSVVVSLEEAG